MNARSRGVPFVLLLAIVATPAIAEDASFASLFDGKTFEGWEGNRDVFRIEDGAIVAGRLTAPVARNEFLCTTKEYGDFELRLLAKLVGAGDNAGIQFRSQRVPNHHEVSGYQCDMGSAFDGSVWGALYDESRRNKMLAQGPQEIVQKALKANEWNELTVRCEGPRIQIWLNGQPTVDYTEQEDVARRGVIGLQIHGGQPAEASYKEIRLRELTAATKDAGAK